MCSNHRIGDMIMSSSNKLGKLKLRRILSSLKSMCFLRGRLDDFSTVVFPATREAEKCHSLEVV
jgi:hypothetical protein